MYAKQSFVFVNVCITFGCLLLYYATFILIMAGYTLERVRDLSGNLPLFPNRDQAFKNPS